MIELLDKSFKAVMVVLLQQAIENTVVTNQKLKKNLASK